MATQKLEPKDELLRKFSKNFRKAMMDNRENADTKNGNNGNGNNGTPRSVKFNPQVMETSLGGTQSQSKVKFNDSSILSSVSLNSSTTSISSVASTVSGDEVTTPVKSATRQFTIPEKPDRQRKATQLEKSVEPDFITPVKQMRRHTMEPQVMATPECFHPVTFETPLAKGKHRYSVGMIDPDAADEDSSSVTVAVRCRPFSQRELTEPDVQCVVSMDDHITTLTSDSGMVHNFSYDYSFWSFDTLGGSFAGQEYVYNTLAQPLLGKAFEGYNVCLFAYGQTGSGKSYSVMGHNEEPGIIPRFCEELFGRIADSNDEKLNINVEISFFEIYNEKIHDLLGQTKDKTGKKTTLKVREHPVLGPFVEGLSSYVVESFDDVNGWLSVGNKHRATASTGMNDKSSRSHSVFTMILTQTKTDTIEGEEHQHSTTSKINLVDLAGSERQSLARTSGDRLREGSSINKSLLNLGKVISLLAEQSQSTNKKKKVFISYRDSVLTWLLKESLGGNSKTTMLATISPANVHLEETLSTLRYAQQARKIINTAKVNEDPKAKLIRELRAEIDKLRQATGGVVSDDVIGASLAEIESLRIQLMAKEREMDEMTRNWQERLKQSEERKLEEAKQLERSGISFKVDNKQPNLVNLSEDPLLSETLLYVLKEGQTRVGRMSEGSRLDIQLSGPLIADNHCTLTNYDSTVSIKPTGDAQTYVNGNQITGPTVLHHGDRVILGGDHYFRFNHPGEVKDRRSNTITTGGASGIRDFEFARQELTQVQNEKLQAELEEVKRKHQEELEAELLRHKSEAEQAMMEEIERKKAEADQELSLQRHEYEDKLRELERTLAGYRQQKQESEHDKVKAKEMIDKLEQEKMILEKEILAKRKFLELEAKAAQKMVLESRQSHSKIVEQLEVEKQKIMAEVRRLEEMRTKRGKPLPGLGVLGRIPLGDGVKKDLFQVGLLLREATKISQCLKKDVVFVREEVEGETMVKVMQKSLDISTFWTMPKFEERLLQLRELYQMWYSNEAHVNSEDLDKIFNDPNDTWEREDRLVDNVAISPKLLKGAVARRNSIAKRAMRLSIESSSPATPTRTPATPGTPTIREETSQNTKSEGNETETRVPIIGICRELISLSLENFKGAVMEETLADKVLVHSELVKTGVTNILDAFNKAIDNKSKGEFVESEVVRISSIQVSCSLRHLLTLCGLWTNTYSGVHSGLIRSLCDGLMAAVRKLGTHLALFLQGCENDVDSLVQSSASQLISSLLALGRHAGELALASEVNLTVLHDWSCSSDDSDEEQTRVQLSQEVKAAFLAGCETFVDRTLQGAIKSVDNCESKIRSINDDLNNSQQEPSKSSTESSMYSELEVLVSSMKDLLQKCQRAQAELDATCVEKEEGRGNSFYQRAFSRSRGMIQHTSSISDKLTVLTQAAQARLKGEEEGTLRKMYRTVEVLEHSREKLVACTTQDNTDSPDVSLISDDHSNQIEIAGQDVKLTAASLMDKVKKVALEERQGKSVNKERTPGKPVPAITDTPPLKALRHKIDQQKQTRQKRILPPSPDDKQTPDTQDPLKRKNIKPDEAETH